MNATALRTWVLAPWLCLLGACAVAPPLGRVARDEPLNIEVVVRHRPDGAVDIRNRAVADGASTGGVGGSIGGGLWGLACGPFAPLCVPLGMGLGVVVGGATGALVGLTGALPAADLGRLQARVARLNESHDLAAELRSQVAERARKRWTLPAEPGGTTLALEIQGMRLTTTREQRVSLTVWVTATVRRPGATQGPTAPGKRYEVVGPYASLAAWTDEQGDVPDTSLSVAFQQIAAAVVSDLALE